MITNEERLNLEARIKELEESCRVKDQKFNKICSVLILTYWIESNREPISK